MLLVFCIVLLLLTVVALYSAPVIVFESNAPATAQPNRFNFDPPAPAEPKIQAGRQTPACQKIYSLQVGRQTIVKTKGIDPDKIFYFKTGEDTPPITVTPKKAYYGIHKTSSWKHRLLLNIPSVNHFSAFSTKAEALEFIKECGLKAYCLERQDAETINIYMTIFNFKLKVFCIEHFGESWIVEKTLYAMHE